MSCSNRDLVEFYISYKLSQRNYPNRLLGAENASGRTEGEEAGTASTNGSLTTSSSSNRPETLASSHGGEEAVKAALQDAADRFEQRFTEAFSDLSSKLSITTFTAYHSFKSVMDELFKDGINWGRIVGVFVFGGALCVECVEKDMSHLVSRITGWMSTYLDEHIGLWIQSNGGWDCFAEIYGRDGAAEARRSQEAARRLLLVGVMLLTGALIAAVLIKKSR
ncbi:bcl-2-like protein 1 [Genypterus blacodes]|uniref:bcl-2-like protein 1 n=1 Tax=Genypterus blacodes TaxID=154954 RepID=UPI003F768AA2